MKRAEREQNAVLGRDVTEAARSKNKGGTTIVFSVRLAVDDVRQLEQLSRQTGRTVSQIVREAIQNYTVTEPRFNITTRVRDDLPVVTMGTPMNSTRVDLAVKSSYVEVSA